MTRMVEMEEMRNFSITLVSADNLPDIRKSGRMKVYAQVSLNGAKKECYADKAGETNPRWNCLFKYTIKDSYVTRDVGLSVVVRLYCERSMGDKYIGGLSLPVKGLFDYGLTCEKTLTYDVGGTSNGKLNIRYSFGGVFLEPKQRPLNWQRHLVSGAFGIALIVKGVWFFATGDTGDWMDPVFGLHDD